LTGLLLMNLGTPDSPSVLDVRRYLKEFLSDPLVLDGPAWRRKLILHLFILPRRPRRSAAAYRRIWTSAGSPILVHTHSLLHKVRKRLPVDTVAVAGMRYGNPSIQSALLTLFSQDIDRLILFPLYPQSAAATTGSCLNQVHKLLDGMGACPTLQVVPPFFSNPAWLNTQADLAIKQMQESDPDHVIFSFHGLPEHQIQAADPTGHTCLASTDCCATMTATNAGCYRAQCFATARELASLMKLKENRFTVSFQSRLGKVPWIGPYTDAELKRLAGEGHRNAMILSPSFVADCLETLDELGNEAAATWKAAGGHRLDLVPCVNDEDAWADGIIRLAFE
jgi:ferrochelatase